MRSMSVPDDVDGVAQLLDLLQPRDLADGTLAPGGVGLAEAVVLVALQRLEDGFPGALDLAQARVLVGGDLGHAHGGSPGWWWSVDVGDDAAGDLVDVRLVEVVLVLLVLVVVGVLLPRLLLGVGQQRPQELAQGEVALLGGGSGKLLAAEHREAAADLLADLGPDPVLPMEQVEVECLADRLDDVVRLGLADVAR